jgi:hypothetical protein
MKPMEAGRGSSVWPGTVLQPKRSRAKCQADAPALVFFATSYAKMKYSSGCK